MMPLLLDSAVRSLLIGLLVWALLKVFGLRDTSTETIIWTAVLLVALSMPLLKHYLPGLVVVVPYMSAASRHSVTALGSMGAAGASPAAIWLNQFGPACLLGVYLLGLLICLTRLAVGLLLTWRLYLRAQPVEAEWARDGRIRASAALKSPASLAWVILLPDDYSRWSEAKREAVLAHEAAHVARGDFFVQLAASVHCALFWFSPFAWWLQAKLAEIAETASDEAAIRRLDDRVTYAEILLEVARRAQSRPALVAMARAPFIQQRVERILSDAPSQRLNAPSRMLVFSALIPVAFALATAKAAIDPVPLVLIADKISQVKTDGSMNSSSKSPAGTPSAPRIRERAIRPAQHDLNAPAIPEAKEDEVSYNPRALLDPVYSSPRPYLPASTIVHAGATYYIRSTERPVADVSAADGSYRQTH